MSVVVRRRLAEAPSNTLPADREREAFAARLREALRGRGLPEGPTDLAAVFNRGFDGRPVAMHTVRKWLIGEAIPSQARLRRLAALCGVSMTWLAFGDEAPPRHVAEAPAPMRRPSPELTRLFAHIEALGPRDRRLVSALVAAMRRADGGRRADSG